MGTLLLPMGVILVTSLVAQVEVRNNAWKQVHSAPLPYATLFFQQTNGYPQPFTAGFPPV